LLFSIEEKDERRKKIHLDISSKETAVMITFNISQSL
jgi:hypothetical protein